MPACPSDNGPGFCNLSWVSERMQARLSTSHLEITVSKSDEFREQEERSKGGKEGGKRKSPSEYVRFFDPPSVSDPRVSLLRVMLDLQIPIQTSALHRFGGEKVPKKAVPMGEGGVRKKAYKQMTWAVLFSFNIFLDSTSKNSPSPQVPSTSFSLRLVLL